MALTYSKYLQVSHRILLSKGVYDAALDQDFKLHVEPLLLKTCTIPEFVGAYDEFISYFNRFIILAPFVKHHNLSDRFYRQIVESFKFPELANTGLGYSRGSTHGRGISGTISKQLAESAVEIISAGIKDPAVFALMPLFEDNIGADRISDMAISILFERFIAYTKRISTELKIRTSPFKHHGALIGLPAFQNRPIVFIPMSILTELPQAIDYEDIERVCNYNRKLKMMVAKQIGLSWEQYANLKKRDWKKLLLENPQYLNEAVRTYKGLTGVGYDFNQDKADKYVDARLNEFVTDHPLELFCFITDKPDSIVNVTRAILEQFKSLVEDNYMWTIFHRRSRTPDETDWQLFLYSVAITYLKAAGLDIDVTRENNPGVGELDFKFSRGAKGKTVVEIKRSSNQDLLHGYVTQLPLYMRAESAEFGMFVIIKEDFKDDERIQKVIDSADNLRINNQYAPEIIIIDACPKKTASNA